MIWLKIPSWLIFWSGTQQSGLARKCQSSWERGATGTAWAAGGSIVILFVVIRGRAAPGRAGESAAPRWEVTAGNKWALHWQFIQRTFPSEHFIVQIFLSCCITDSQNCGLDILCPLAPFYFPFSEDLSFCLGCANYTRKIQICVSKEANIYIS